MVHCRKFVSYYLSRYGSGKYEIEKCRFLIVCLTFGLKLFRFDVSKLALLIFDPYLCKSFQESISLRNFT